MLLQDKVAVVTGGGRGIGRGIIKRFAREGARVVLAQRDPESGERTRREVEEAGGTALFIQTDVAQREQVDRLIEQTVEHFGGLDIMINNAGITGISGHILEMPQETWDRIIAVNQTAVFMCAQAAARVMAKAGHGNIINISSVNGFVPQPGCCAYGAAKGALETMTKSMAADLAPYHIRVNCIAPGPIQVDQPDDAPPGPAAMALLGRSGLPAEVAAAAAFLVSQEGSYITGQTLVVDGGTLVNAYNIYNTERPDPKA
jgi:3-oxoacyl-[acyl-carrier protein] reductase